MSEAHPSDRLVEATPSEPGSERWWWERQERVLRRRPRPSGLTIERIINVALGVVDAEGLAVLTVRRLAEELSTGSSSLYRHVASRHELLVLAVDQVLGEIVLAPPQLDGRAKVEWSSRELRRVLMAHPNLLPALTSAPLLGPNAVRGAESGFSNLLDTGLDPAAAVGAYLALVDLVLGSLYFDTSRVGRRPQQASVVDGIDGGGDVHPLFRAHGSVWVRPPPDEVFEFGLATFLDGLRCPGLR